MIPGIGNTEMYSPSQIMKKQGLDRSAFLRLLVTELTYQDPINPVDDKDFIAQLAQFSSLEAMEGMSVGFENLSRSSQWVYAISLIGKHVSGIDENGNEVSGIVTSAKIKDKSIVVSLNDGTSIDLNTIKEVK